MSTNEKAPTTSPAEYGSYPSSSSTSASLPTPSVAFPASAMQNPKRPSHVERWAARASDSQFNALAGALGGFTSGIITCPLDVIKTKLQAQGGFHAAQQGGQGIQRKLYNGLFGTARVIWRDEGLRGMYRGLGPIILGYLPTWAVWFTVYNKNKVWMSQYQHNTFVVNFWSSIIAGASSTIVTNPIWVIKTRLMSQTGRHSRTSFSLFPKGSSTPTSRPTLHMASPWHYNSTIDAARKMYTTEGVRAFYSGLSPALLGLTHVAVQFPAYEYLKTKFTGQGMGAPTTATDGKAHWLGILSASIMSKILASSATYPHEVIRTRLQTQRRPMPGNGGVGNVGGIPGVKQGSTLGEAPAAKQAQEAPMKYQGVVRTFRTILHEEGWRAFYAGMGTNMMRAVPAATVTMLTYEFVMRELNRTRMESRSRIEAFREDPSFA